MRIANSNGFYELNPFPGCNQIVVSNHAYIKPELRGQGFGQFQHTNRLAEMQSLCYDYVICTVKANNLKEKHILNKNGWKHLDMFHNRETENDIEIWGRKV